MYQIKLINSVYDNASEATIYDQSAMNTYSVTGPKCTLELNTSGTLSFTLMPDHPEFNNIWPMSSFVKVLDDGEEIFYGRVLQRSHPTLTGQVSFNCEGAISFLLDSEVPPNNKGTVASRTMTAEAFLNWCITKHNADVSDPRRQFTVGTVNADERSKSEERQITSYTQTKNAIESNLINVYGGFLRVRPIPNGTGHYLDWIQQYETVNPQSISIGVNMEDQTNEYDGSSMFTVLRPIGKDGLELDEKTIDLYSAEDIAKYGRIVKTVNFSDAKNKTELLARATDYKDRIQKTLFITSNINLVDMHYIDGTSPKIHIGDRFTNIVGLEGQTMVAFSLNLDFERPSNDTLDLKNPKSLHPDMTTDGHGHGSTKSSRHAAGQGLQLKYYHESLDQALIDVKQLNIRADELNVNIEDLVRTTSAEFQAFSLRAQNIEDLTHHHDETINDLRREVTDIQGTAVIMNSDRINEVAGKFEIWVDPTSGAESVRLVSGADLAVSDRDGVTIMVGERIDWAGREINGVKTEITNMQGSTIWTQRDEVMGLVGEFDVEEVEVEDPQNPGHYYYQKRLVVKNGGGFRLKQNNVEYGIYTTGNDNNAVLTGGLMVDKINNEVTTKILGTKVDIRATQMAQIGIYTDEHYDGGLLIQRINGNNVSTAISGDKVNITASQMAQLGIYTDSHYDGGLLIQRINGNNVSTAISGDKVNITASQMASIGIYTDEHYDGGFIIDKINDNSTTATIKASRIMLEGNVDLNSILAVQSNSIYAKKGIYFNGITIILPNQVISNTLTIRGNSGPYSAEYSLTSTTLGGMIKTASVDNATNTLTLTKWNGDIINFRKATSDNDIYLTGSWSGGKFTVKAKSVSNDEVIASIDRNLTNGTIQLSGSTLQIPIRAYYGPTPPTYELTGYTQNILLDTMEITENGTFTYTPTDNKWAVYQVTTNVPNDYSDVGVRFNSSSNSYYIENYSISSNNPISAVQSKSYTLGVSGSNVIMRDNRGTRIENTPSLAVTMLAWPLSEGSRTVYAMVGGVSANSVVLTDYTDGYSAGHSAGVTYAYENVSLKFGSASSGGEDTFFIGAYQKSSSTNLISAIPTTTYRLDTIGSRVCIVNTSGSRISMTPTLYVKADEGTLTNGSRTVSVIVGNKTVDSLTITDYRDGYSAGTTDAYDSSEIRFGSENSSYFVGLYAKSSGNRISAVDSKTYQLGLSGTTIQIQSASGSKLANTPTLSVTATKGELSAGSRDITVKVGSTTTHTFTVDDYLQGWTKAANSTNSVIPLIKTASTVADTISASWPNLDTPNGSARSRSYTISVDKNYAYLKITGSDSLIARCANPQYGNGTSDEAASLTVTKPTNASGTLSSNVERVTFDISATGATTHNSVTEKKSFTLSKSTFTNSSGVTQYCVNLLEGSTAIGRISTQTQYNQGRVDEAGTLVVTAPTNNSGDLADTATRTSISIVATGKTTNSSTITQPATFTLIRSTYTNSSGKTYRCVNFREGGTVIGRISVNADYTAGVTAGKEAESDSLVVTAPTNASGVLASSSARTTIKISATGKTATMTEAITKTTSFKLARSTYTTSDGVTNYCVNLTENDTPIGRISTQTQYNAGVNDGKTQGINSITKVTLDSSMNHSGNNWNCILYNSAGTAVRTITVNSAKTTGLIFPVMNKTADTITKNGTYTYTAKSDDSVAGYTKLTVTVDVPDKHTKSYNMRCTQKSHPSASAPFSFTFTWTSMNDDFVADTNYYFYR